MPRLDGRTAGRSRVPSAPAELGGVSRRESVRIAPLEGARRVQERRWPKRWGRPATVEAAHRRPSLDPMAAPAAKKTSDPPRPVTVDPAAASERGTSGSEGGTELRGNGMTDGGSCTGEHCTDEPLSPQACSVDSRDYRSGPDPSAPFDGSTEARQDVRQASKTRRHAASHRSVARQLNLQSSHCVRAPYKQSSTRAPLATRQSLNSSSRARR